MRDAYAAGVKIALGTDTFGLSDHGEKAQEFALTVRAGMPAMEAIKAATANAADPLGSAEVGTSQAGRYADLIALRRRSAGRCPPARKGRIRHRRAAP